MSVRELSSDSVRESEGSSTSTSSTTITSQLTQSLSNSDVSASSSNTSNKTSKTTVGSVERTSSTTSSRVNEKQANKRPAGRVIQSRFKAAAAAAASRDTSGGNNSSGGGGSGMGRSRLNVTLSSTSVPPGSKPQQTRPQRSGMIPVSQGRGKLTASEASLCFGDGRKDGRSTHYGSTRYLAHSNKGKLHSTILNNTINDVPAHHMSSSVFSTTMVGGFAPGNRKLDVTGVSLPYIPDVSAIELEGKIAESTTLSQGEKSEEGVPVVEVTSEHLEQEYLSYLQWHYLDVNSEAAFTHHLAQLQDVTSFLEHLSSEKMSELSDQLRVCDLLHHHQRATQAHQTHTQLLNPLLESLPEPEEALKTMSRELEKYFNQVKLDNLHIPHDHKQYADELREALETQQTLLCELGKQLEPRMQYLEPTNNLLNQLHATTQHIQRCEQDVQQAASLAVQEASLLIGAKQVKTVSDQTTTDDSHQSLNMQD